MIHCLGGTGAEINALVVLVPSVGSEDKAVPCPLWVSTGGPQPLALIGMLILHSAVTFSWYPAFVSSPFSSKDHSHCTG